MTLAVEHLYHLGHRRIGHVAGPWDTSTGARRTAGFVATARVLELDDPPIVEAVAFAEAAGLDAARALLADAPEVTGIVAANDLIALGAIVAVNERDLRCPEDISVVGFNDMPFVDRFNPPLTTIRVAEYEIGRRAARLLLERIDRPAEHPETILISPELVVRGSTAPVRTEGRARSD